MPLPNALHPTCTRRDPRTAPASTRGGTDGLLWESGHPVPPSMRAGDLLLFMANGQTYGVDAWRAEEGLSLLCADE